MHEEENYGWTQACCEDEFPHMNIHKMTVVAVEHVYTHHLHTCYRVQACLHVLTQLNHACIGWVGLDYYFTSNFECFVCAFSPQKTT